MKRLIFSLLLGAFLSGCTTIDPAAFQRGKVYPVVSTYLDVMKTPDRRVLVKGDSSQISAANDTKDIVDAFTSRFLAGFSKHIPVKITFGKQITGHPAYRSAGFPRRLDQAGLHFVAPQGYGVYFGSDETKLIRLINRLGADGGIVVYHHLSLYPSNAKGTISSVAVAYDKAGKKVLQYTANYDYPIGKHMANSTIDLQAAKRAAVQHAQEAGNAFGKLVKAQLK